MGIVKKLHTPKQGKGHFLHCLNTLETVSTGKTASFSLIREDQWQLRCQKDDLSLKSCSIVGWVFAPAYLT